MSEYYLSGFIIHSIDYRKRLYSYAALTQSFSAFLKSFFDEYSDSAERRSRSVYDIDQSVDRASVCKKIIYDKYLVFGR